MRILETANMKFTILTATYNRAYILPKLYASLCDQTFREFEWVIVDDGSCDGTKELVASWKPFFEIRYVWQPNRGKHTALNRGVPMAKGELIYAIDSDDYLLPDALEILNRRWNEIPEPRRLACLTGLCRRPDGSLISETLPSNPFDSFSYGLSLKTWKGDRTGVVRADAWREFPFPEFPGEHFIPEGVVWSRLINKYGIRYFNEPLLVMTYAPDGFTSSKRDLRWSNPRGATLMYRIIAGSTGAPFKQRFQAAINLLRFAFISAIKVIVRC
jgi:glycosyltransferase involved in cell wall biosynthesis